MKSRLHKQAWILLCLAGLVSPGQNAAADDASDRRTPLRLTLIVAEGAGAINNIKKRSARETVVRVQDENHKPVAGAAVLFLLPSDGPGASFADGATSATVVTDKQGQAQLPRMQANQWAGSFRIRVSASYQNLQSSTEITQTNVAAVRPPIVHAGISAKAIGIIAGVAVAAGAGAVVASRSSSKSSSSTPAPPTPVGISLGGGPTLGPPH